MKKRDLYDVQRVVRLFPSAPQVSQVLFLPFLKCVEVSVLPDISRTMKFMSVLKRRAEPDIPNSCDTSNMLKDRLCKSMGSFPLIDECPMRLSIDILNRNINN